MDDPQLSREWEDEMLLTRMILVNECDKEGVGTLTLACHADMLVACVDTGACNFSNLPLVNMTEIMSI